MAVPKKGEGWGLVGCSKEVACLAVPQEGARAWGGIKGFGSGRVGVSFFESWRVDFSTFILCQGHPPVHGSDAKRRSGLLVSPPSSQSVWILLTRA